MSPKGLLRIGGAVYVPINRNPQGRQRFLAIFSLHTCFRLSHLRTGIPGVLGSSWIATIGKYPFGFSDVHGSREMNVLQ